MRPARSGSDHEARTALRMRAFTDSIALVVHTIRRISRSKPRNGTNSAHAFSPQPDDRRILGAPGLGELEEQFLGSSATVAAWQTGFSPREKGVPVLAGGVLEAVGSTRSAVSALPPVRFCGPPSEPGVPVSVHRALHECRYAVVVWVSHGLGMFVPRYR